MTKPIKRKSEDHEEASQANDYIKDGYVAKRTYAAPKKVLKEIQKASSFMKVENTLDDLEVQLLRLDILDKTSPSLVSPLVSALLDRHVVPNKKGTTRPFSKLEQSVSQHEEFNSSSFCAIKDDLCPLSGSESSDDEISSIEGMC